MAKHLRIVSNDGNPHEWLISIATEVPDFDDHIETYNQIQEQDSDDETDLPPFQTQLSDSHLDQIYEYLQDKQEFISSLNELDYGELTELKCAAEYLGLRELDNPVLNVIKQLEKERQKQPFYQLLIDSLNEIINFAPEYYTINTQAQTNGSYEDRLEILDELKKDRNMLECKINHLNFSRSYFETLVRLALFRVICIIKYHGAKSNENHDFGLSIATVFECLVCALYNVRHVGASGDGGIDGLSDKAVIQCKAGKSHRNSATKIWRELIGTCLIHCKSIGILAVTDSSWQGPSSEYEEGCNKSLSGSTIGSIQLKLYSPKTIISDLMDDGDSRGLCIRFLDKLNQKKPLNTELYRKLVELLKSTKLDETMKKLENERDKIDEHIQTTENAIDDDISGFDRAFYDGYYYGDSSEQEDNDDDDYDDDDDD